MQRLSGIDAAFFYMETPVQHMHAMGVTILDPAGIEGGFDPEAARLELARRMIAMPMFRRRLAQFPLGLDHPTWIDGEVDPDRHVTRAALPSPGSRAQLERMIGEFASRPLPRDLPLWECCLVEGLEGGRLALLMKAHHAIVDGVSGAQVLAHLFDLEPVRPAPVATLAARAGAEAAPSLLDLALASARTRLLDPVRMGTAALRTLRWALQAATSQTEVDAGTMPLSAPHTPFSRALSPRRSVALTHAALADLKTIKNTFGTTINDGVLAACTMAMRRQLQRRGCPAERALVASVPVSSRKEGEESASYNRVTAMFVGLPVHLSDPVDQLHAVAADARAAKKVMGSLGKELLGQWMELAPPLLFSQAMRLYSRFQLADVHAPVHNLVISNVPGPSFPLYSCGARVEAVYPLGPILEGAALNVTVFSYRDRVEIGVVTCPDVVDDVGGIADDIADAVFELAELARQAIHPEEAQRSAA